MMFGPWRYDRYGATPGLTYPPAGYDLPADLFASVADVERWALHLSAKRWAGRDVLRGAIHGMLRIVWEKGERVRWNADVDRIFKRALEARRRAMAVGRRLEAPGS